MRAVGVFCVLSFAIAVFSACDRGKPKSVSRNVEESNDAASAAEESSTNKTLPETGATTSDPTSTTRILFDGSDLENWEPTQYGGEGECRIENGEMIVEMGTPMSGMTCIADDLPTMNYEISLEAKRVEGIDFFCCLTFPVSETHCSLIVGGWAGSLVGLSCIDEKDASDNETKVLLSFDDDRWYRIRVAVEPDKICCWIDDEKVVDLVTKGRKISLRNETLPSRPLGLGTFQTTAAFRNIELKIKQ